MEYAVVRSGGKQYRVAKGDILEVDRLPSQEDGVVTFEEVLLWVGENHVKVGTPLVKGVQVKVKVLEEKKGKKIRVAKYKAKVRYRRVMGFRPLLTRLQIEKIESAKPTKIDSFQVKGKSEKASRSKVV